MYACTGQLVNPYKGDRYYRFSLTLTIFNSFRPIETPSAFGFPAFGPSVVGMIKDLIYGKGEWLIGIEARLTRGGD
jgi:hypothetical protein